MTVVSVIIPAYNVAPYLDACLRSALSQTLADIEVIVVDDASSDGTRGVIERLAQADSRLKAIFLADNGGVCRARNRALDAAKGDWIAVLDADDWMAPSRLARMVETAEKLGADWLVDDQYFIREGDNRPVARLFADEPPGARLIAPAHLVIKDQPELMGYGLVKPLVRRAFLNAHAIRYRPGTERFEDFLFDIECAAAGARLAILNEPLYYYLLRQGSLTALNPDRTMRGLLAVNSEASRVARRTENRELVATLDRRARLIRRGMRYNAVVQPLKKRDLVSSLTALCRDVAIAPYVLQKLARRLWFRLARRDRIALVLLPGIHLRP